MYVFYGVFWKNATSQTLRSSWLFLTIPVCQTALLSSERQGFGRSMQCQNLESNGRLPICLRMPQLLSFPWAPVGVCLCGPWEAGAGGLLAAIPAAHHSPTEDLVHCLPSGQSPLVSCCAHHLGPCGPSLCYLQPSPSRETEATAW